MVSKTVAVLLFFVVSECVAKISYKVSQMNEEEDTVLGSLFLTDSQLCDGCIAVAYQIHLTFEVKHDNRPDSLGDLPDHQLIEALGKQYLNL